MTDEKVERWTIDVCVECGETVRACTCNPADYEPWEEPPSESVRVVPASALARVEAQSEEWRESARLNTERALKARDQVRGLESRLEAVRGIANDSAQAWGMRVGRIQSLLDKKEGTNGE